MLSLRSRLCSPSDLVYGQSLRLPQEFSSATLANNLMNRSQLVTKLRDFVENLQPPSPREHQGKFFIDKNLNDSKRVFIRNDHLQQPLSPRFSGPYDVVSRHEKYFIISLDGKNKSVFIDRLKACRKDFPPPLANPPVESNPSLVQETYRTRKGDSKTLSFSQQLTLVFFFSTNRLSVAKLNKKDKPSKARLWYSA